MSRSEASAIPGLAVFPERHWPREGALDRAAAEGFGFVRRLSTAILPDFAARRLLAGVNGHAADLAGASDRELRARADILRRAIRHREDLPQASVALAFALVREAAARTIGQRHHDVQILAGGALLGGRVAEVRTGEGKTLIATLPAATVALSGFPVHVVTVSDYLAERDAEGMGPVYAFFGLNVGVICHGLSPDERRRAYDCDVTYCTNKELAFDYLRDRLVLGAIDGELLRKSERFVSGAMGQRATTLRGLHFALVDEADSVLVDEARTPLVLSQPVADQIAAEDRQRALDLAGRLGEGDEFRILRQERRLMLTPAGTARIEAAMEEFDGIWAMEIAREELVLQALSALHIFRRDRDYLVSDGRIRIIDEYSGRVMEDRFWNAGLHQMIEMKEGCPPSVPNGTIARMTYQRFFRRYRRLAGMSGTLQEVAGEVWSVYRLTTTTIPPNRPSRTVKCPDRFFPTSAERWRALAQRALALHRTGAPVLIGTRSVEASRIISAALDEAGVPHVVLNAEQTRDEAEIVARAGSVGAVTVATNMAGRGTDILIGPGVEALGGLHVLMSERHDARRIDRQLAGRTGRQGAAGRFEVFLSLEDQLLDQEGARLAARLARALMPVAGPWPARLALFYAQASAERLHARMRRDLLAGDDMLSDRLAFSGRIE